MDLAAMLATRAQRGSARPSWQPGAVVPPRVYRPEVARSVEVPPAVPDMAPIPQWLDRTQPANPLEQQLALRRMMQSRGRGLTAGSGYDKNAAPVSVPSRMASSRRMMPGIPTPERAPVTASIYGGR